jgi:LAS superfamily LD-carboxypeptidase LdcB
VHGYYLDGGTSLFETLEGITAAQASQPVGGKCATLAAQVKHVTFYLDVVNRSLITKENGDVDWGEIWRTTREVTPEQWQALKENLQQAYQRVLATLQGFDTWEDGDRISDAMATVVHTAYHLGEIRQAMCTLVNPV